LDAGRFIKDLLYQSDIVRLPGLGSFISTYQNARTDISGKKISPPAKSFQFEDSDKDDDDLIWSWISEQEGLSESEAKTIVADFVADVSHEIHEGREVIIEGLGTFYADVTGKTEFHFTVENNFNAESIGFIDLDLPDSDLDAFISQPEPIIHHEVKINTPLHIQPEVHEVYAELVHSHVPPPVYVKKSHQGNWIIPVLVLVAFILAFLAYEQRTEISELAHTWFAKGNTNLADTLNKKQKADSSLEKTLAEKAKMQKALDVQSIDSTKVFVPYGTRHMKYYVVAASFTNYDYALKLKEELRGKGFDSEIVTVTHKYYKVTMGSYTDRQQAMVELEKLKTITQNTSLWLLHI
jgi:nucleoid DNA-binding protein/cell division septation protein DedD